MGRLYWQCMTGLKDLIDSFRNRPGGFSARKLTAFAFVLFAGYIHLRYLTPETAIAALLIDAVTALLALGIITAENVIKLRHGEK